MCGIIAIVGTRCVADRLVDGLRRMEYRGYDSAGLCVVEQGDEKTGKQEKLVRRRAEGKLVNLTRELADNPLSGSVGIGHTRWATHGAPTTNNAHPHATGEVALVHNGIIENFRSLRATLAARGCVFESDTDTEVIAHLLSEQIEAGHSPQEAVKTVLPQLRGAFALAMMFRRYPDMLIGARLGSPLVVGHSGGRGDERGDERGDGQSGGRGDGQGDERGDRETYLGSDALALAPLTQTITYLDEGDWVVATREGIQIFNRENKKIKRQVVAVGVSAAAVEKGNYHHYMQKEIFEQPTVVAQSLSACIHSLEQKIVLPPMGFEFDTINRITIVACGSSYYAGMIARYWLEAIARIAVDVDIASEFRYRYPVLASGELAMFISQSGETADTLAALRHARREKQNIIAIVNVPTSSMAREADFLLPIHAGPEIGVASTKAFSCQLAVLAAFAVHLGAKRKVLNREEERSLVGHFAKVPAALNAALGCDAAIAAVARLIVSARDVLYMGRGAAYPLALEGALKLKEISYIHAEGYAGGEMKHGPIALIDDAVPVIVLAPSGPLFEKTISNMQEVMARGGKVVLVSDAEGLAALGADCIAKCLAKIAMPSVDPLIAPIVHAVAVQLLAYHVAALKGTDVDQPRNLAKSVTVE